MSIRFILLGLLIVMIALSPYLAISDDPCPSAGEASKVEQNETKPVNQTGENDQDRTPPTALVVNVEDGPQANGMAKHCAQKKNTKPLEDWRMWLSPVGWGAGFTGMLVVVGVGQLCMFLYQLRLLRRTADLARKEFVAIHPPRLVVRRDQVRCTPDQHGINLVIRNIGDTTASDIEIDVNIEFRISTDTSIMYESMPPYRHKPIKVDWTLMAGEAQNVFAKHLDITAHCCPAASS